MAAKDNHETGQDGALDKKDIHEKSGDMDWNDCWEKGNTMWRFKVIYWPLEKHLESLTGGKPSTFYVPMCGDMLDMKWLMDRGHTIVGVEIAERAALNFFADQKLEYVKEEVPGFGLLYKAKNGLMKFYVGDVLKFSSQIAGGKVDCAYDVGAMQALDTDHEKYANVMLDLLKDDGKLLINLMGFFTGDAVIDHSAEYPKVMEKPYKALVEKFDTKLIEHYEQTMDMAIPSSTEHHEKGHESEEHKEHAGYSVWNWFYMCTRK